MLKKSLLILIILICFYNFNNAEVSKMQDINNMEYLSRLDENVVSTIKMLIGFKKMSDKLPGSIKGKNYYNSFLMNMVMECSNIREGIKNSEEMNKKQREKQISLLIKSIKSDLNFSDKSITPEIAKKDNQFLKNSKESIKRKSGLFKKMIVEEEETVMEEKTITPKYLDLHSHNFLYSLLGDYIENASLLTPKHRNMLVEIIKSIQANDPMEKK